MKKKILIATKNNSKFEVVKNILKKSGFENFEFSNLNQLNLLEDMGKEVGTVLERAEQKANFIANLLKDNNDFYCIIGIDDAIEIRGKIDTEVKKLMPSILNDELLNENEEVKICRAFCFKTKNNIFKLITKIPFKYKKYNGEITDKFYPLSHVFYPLNSDFSFSQMDEENANLYNLNFCKEELLKISNFI